MADRILKEAWIELSIAGTVILLRLYFRFTQVGLRGMALDDLLMVFAGMLFASEVAVVYCLVMIWHGVSNNIFTPDQRAALKPGSQVWRDAVHASKGHIVGWFTYTGAVWMLKACWAIYYSRIIYGFDRMNIRIKIAGFLIGTTYIAVVAMIIFKCWPLHKQWQVRPDPGNNCYPGASKMNVIFIAALNVITDIYLMVIPIPIIYKAHWSRKRRIWLCLLFSSGGVVIIFSLLRCILLVRANPNEPTTAGQWSIRESFVAIFISNTPMAYAQCKKWAVDVAHSTRVGDSNRSRHGDTADSRDPIAAGPMSTSGRSNAVPCGRGSIPCDPFQISFSSWDDTTEGSVNSNRAAEV